MTKVEAPRVITVPPIPSHPAAGRPVPGADLPDDTLRKVPAGMPRYAVGDPLAVLPDGSEVYTTRDRGMLVPGVDHTGMDLFMRDLVRTAYQRADQLGTAQAILQAEDGSRWLASLTKSPAWGGVRVPRGSHQMGPDSAAHPDMLAIVDGHGVLNWSDQPIRKPHWWDGLIGRDYVERHEPRRRDWA